MAQEEIKRQPKEFVSPVEKPSLNGETIADICDYIVSLKKQLHYTSSRNLCVKLQKDIDKLNVREARILDCGDELEKLKRNALAVTNLLDMLQMAIENTQSNIRDIITARDAEHERYLQYVAKLRKAWQQQQYDANKKRKRTKNQED